MALIRYLLVDRSLACLALGQPPWGRLNDDISIITVVNLLCKLTIKITVSERAGSTYANSSEVQVCVAIMHESHATAATKLITISYISVKCQELR